MTKRQSDDFNPSSATENIPHLRDQEFVGGFFLTSKEFETVENYDPVPLLSGWTFWNSNRGVLKLVTGNHNNQLIVFGNFYHLEEKDSGKALQRLLEAFEAGELEFESETDLLVGRYVLIVVSGSQTFVYNDALGTRSIYYSIDGSAISSHFHLLARQLGIETDHEWDERRMAMDLTMSSKIRQLLPNFRLDCEQALPQRYFPRRKNEFSDWSHEEKIAEITRLWKTSLDSLLAINQNVVFSITGGLDSRLSISMAHAHWSEIVLYTYGSKEAKDTNYSRMMNKDYLISRELVNYIQPKEYRFIHLADNKRLHPELSSLIKTNSITRHGPGLVQRYRDEFRGDDWVHVRSTGIEVTRSYFGSNDSVASITRTCELDGATDFHSRIHELGYDAPQYEYNKKDLIYWELRMGKWHSEVLNENDAAFETILPHNSRRLIKLFLAYPLPQRRSAFALKELINDNAPILNFFGVNDTRNLYEIVRDGINTKNESSHDSTVPTSKELVTHTTKLVSSRGIRSLKRRFRIIFSRISRLKK